MSSSVFVETPRSASVSGNGGDPSSINADSNSQLLGNADSNLVVVYGKNGINVDRKGLENLIDEKTLTSISVIRITSPTQSMEDEEAEEVRKEAELQALEDEESNSDHDNEDEEETSDSEVEEKAPKANKALAKVKRPEIVGLTVEEFYPPNEAKELAKEILKYAGVTPLKCNVDYEFQRYVIKNDHCYTPFTSPSQLHETKLQADDEAKQPATNIRKLPIKTSATVKQYLNKRKQNLDDQQRKNTEKGKEKLTIGLSSTIDSSNIPSPNDAKDDSEDQPDEEADQDANEDDDGSDYVSEESEESAETDNDRDSDSDFDVNNRHGKKRKNPVARRKKKERQRARNLAMQKATMSNKRRPQSPDEEMKVAAPLKTNKQLHDLRKSVGGSVSKTIARKQIPDDDETTVVIPPVEVTATPPTTPVQPAKQLINIQSVEIVKPVNKIDISSAVMRSSYQIKSNQAPTIVPPPPLAPLTPTPVSTQQQNVKQIVINKVIASPKGGFMDLNTLLARSDNSLSNLTVAEINSPEKQSLTKGFMPLGIETAAKNQLPAQISIQTHQSSSEIAAENDKQLDLIDSIVKDELDRSAGGLEPTEKRTIKENSIPDLVKMLESTEKAVLENKKIVSSSFTTSSSSVEAIDIANAPLLENADDDDDIPEDLLQHVVELMEDKSLQEAVEMQALHEQEQKQELAKQLQQINPIILPQSHSQTQSQSQMQSIILPAPAPAPAPIRQQPHAPVVMSTPLKQPKSIIEASISNTTTPSSSRDTTPTPTLNRTTNVTYLRKEPIQIVRGNGRVITLPPIEAPTTRAKRRAQNQPPASDTSFNDSESCDVSMHSDASFLADSSQNPVLDRSETVAATPPVQQTKEKTTKAAGKRKAAAKSKATVPAKVEPKDAGDSQEDEDEDDPNKLWCICRQPHNNRFMICCDKCEDWFHGTCVSITKAMGLEMEQNGVEWTCPKCVKKFETKKQRKITDIFENKKTVVQLMPQLDGQKKYQTTPIQSKITDAFNKKTVVQLMPQLEDNNLSRITSLNQQQQQPNLNNTITLQEVTGENKQLIDLKKLQPGKFYTLTPSRTTPSTPTATAAASKRAQAMKTPDSVQNKTLKSTPENSSSVVGNITKRVIILPSTVTSTPVVAASPSQQKPVNRGAAMVKASALQQQQLKFGKVQTAAEKKQFAMTKQQHEQQQQQLNKNSTQNSVSVLDSQDHHQQPPQTIYQQPKKSTVTQICIVCKKNARENSIYCSDDCIRKHAQNALNAVKTPEPVPPTPLIKLGPDEKKKKNKGLFEDLLSMADRKPKVERVSVLERRTGKLLTGSNAPTTLNLKKWLQDNPTFEVVQPGSVYALEIEKSKQKSRPNVQSPTNTNTSTPHKADGPIVTSVITLTPPAVSSPQAVFAKHLKQQQQDLNKPNTSSNAQQRTTQTATAVTTTTPNQKQSSKQQQAHQQLHIKTDKSDKDKDKSSLASPSLPSSSQKALKKQPSLNEKETATSPPIRESSEPVRISVRRTLKEQLLMRIKELSDEKKLSEDQVDEFVKATEYEMYRLFNKDTGAKYKAKYRSLMFNIKDRKNETLLLKICGKLIEPRQLVRMSPEELASQELAQWRENEAKHQLEMIKKSELDMLSCTKTYVLKTHKGEEVIEGKAADRVDLDITLPVEDVVTVLNNSVVSSTSEIEASSTSLTPRKDTTLSELEQELAATSSVVPVTMPAASVTSSEKKKDSGSKEKEKERDREKRHKSKDRHREKHRKRSRSRERHHKSSSRKDERREREERSAVATTTKKEEAPESLTKTANKASASQVKQPAPQVPASLQTHAQPKTVAAVKPAVKKITKSTPPPIESFNLIDQILESTKTVEQAANLQKEKPTLPLVASSAHITTATQPSLPRADSTPELLPRLKKPHSPLAAESDQEPSSTVSISTPPEDPYFRYSSDVDSSIWTGSINMIDVASFQVSLQTVSGNTYLLSKDLPEELDIVGRISPDTVWDYIGKIKRSPNKEVVIIRLVPSAESETNAYTILYKYLDKRKRLGVIKTSSNIKDFYIMPLGVGQQMPSVLQPSENFDFYDDVMRPDVLLGIVIRIMGKRHSNASMRRKKESTVISNRTIKSVLDADGSTTFTPPGSPKTKTKNTDSHRSMQATISSRSGIRMVQKSTDDEEIDIDAIIKAPITAKKTSSAQSASSVPSKKDDADEPYSPGGGSSDDEIPPANISVRDDDLKRKMDEINRQIEAQKMEIAGLLSHDQSSSLANISIPSNLHQILASIQSKPEPPSQALQSSSSGKVPTMVPPPPMIGSLSHHSHDEEYVPEQQIAQTSISRDPKTSRLAQLSEAELLSMVPDNIDLESSNTSSHRNVSGLEPPAEKRARWSEPPPPGMETEFN